MESPPIPLTVVGGYLGSGKTTLINHLLRCAGGRRLLILVNDFGDLDIDAQLLAASDGETISLANGCICCAIGDRLMSTLMMVSRQTPPPEHLVIETSGIADPAQVARIGMAGRRFVLQTIVVLADAAEIRARADDAYVGDIVRRQLKAADLLVLNKADLVDAATRGDVRAWLAPHAAGIPLTETTEARVSPDLVFAHRHSAPVSPRTKDTEDHLHGVTSRSVTFGGAVEATDLGIVLDGLPDGIFRVKGLIRLKADGSLHLLNRVGRRLTVTPAPSPLNGSSDNQVVLIGRANEVESSEVDMLLDRIKTMAG